RKRKRKKRQDAAREQAETDTRRNQGLLGAGMERWMGNQKREREREAGKTIRTRSRVTLLTPPSRDFLANAAQRRYAISPDRAARGGLPSK
ncbi:hypothetical protein K0M31_017700, partial [Melipona bicolor]